MKEISLGTAYWGWSVSEKEANEILNLFYANGGRFVDSAFNYPISSKPNDLNKSFLILSNWIKRNKINDLKINYKIGSISNEHIPKNNTSERYLRDQFSHAVDISSNNIYSIMIHWDNSGSLKKIYDTCLFLKEIQTSGLRIGLSGIKNPKMYLDSMSDLNFLPIDLQVKSNFVQSNLDHYKIFDSRRNRFWAYGISLGGLKIEYSNLKYSLAFSSSSSINKKPIVTEFMKDKIYIAMQEYQLNSIYELSIANAEQNDSLYGYIIGPSNSLQMKSILKFLHSLKLRNIANNKKSKIF